MKKMQGIERDGFCTGREVIDGFISDGWGCGTAVGEG